MMWDRRLRLSNLRTEEKGRDYRKGVAAFLCVYIYNDIDPCCLSRSLFEICFHSRTPTIDLAPLNILIGENTAGKSNLIEAVSLLQAAPSQMRNALLRGGGVHFWLWLGDGMPGAIATLACRAQGSTYRMDFSEDAGGFVILNESLSGDSGQTWFTRTGQSADIGSAKGYPVDRAVSVFASYKIPADETPTTKLGSLFGKIRIYREFQAGPRSGSRLGIGTNSSSDYLVEGGGTGPGLE